jgi:hypothetical protein
MKTGISLFVYNRPQHTAQVLEGLKKNKICHLYVYCDGPKTLEDKSARDEVVSLVKSIDWCDTDIEVSPSNRGLANSIINGVTKVLQRHERIIVPEDDCIPAPDFINFIYDIFFSYRPGSWGWGTWRDRWNKFDPEISGYDELVNNYSLQKGFNRGGNDLFPMLKKQKEGLIDFWAIRLGESVLQQRN